MECTDPLLFLFLPVRSMRVLKGFFNTVTATQYFAVIPMAIFGIPPSAHTLSPKSPPDFASKFSLSSLK